MTTIEASVITSDDVVLKLYTAATRGQILRPSAGEK